MGGEGMYCVRIPSKRLSDDDKKIKRPYKSSITNFDVYCKIT